VVDEDAITVILSGTYTQLEARDMARCSSVTFDKKVKSLDTKGIDMVERGV
jgi:hypothetical protein